MNFCRGIGILDGRIGEIVGKINARSVGKLGWLELNRELMVDCGILPWSEGMSLAWWLSASPELTITSRLCPGT